MLQPHQALHTSLTAAASGLPVPLRKTPPSTPRAVLLRQPSNNFCFHPDLPTSEMLSFHDLGFKGQLQHTCYCIVLQLYLCTLVYIHVPTYMCLCTYMFCNVKNTPYIYIQKQEKVRQRM